MRRNRPVPLALFALLALLWGCAQQPPRAGATDVSVVVLPRPDGHVGAVVVRPLDGGKPVLIDKPYVEARMSDNTTVRKASIDRKQVDLAYARTLIALPAAPTTYLVYFVEGTEELKPDAKRTIDKVMAELGTRPAAELAVVGHTDFVGSDQYNDTLSLRRALRVKELLARRGVPAMSIQAAGRGKREPLVRTSDDVAELRNRRVEIIVR